MLELKKEAVAGTMDSGDIQIQISPNQKEGIEINLHSPLKKVFGKAIENRIYTTLKEMEIERAILNIQDKGALDFVVEARCLTAICRAAEIHFDWKRDIQKRKPVNKIVNGQAPRAFRSSLYVGGTAPSRMVQAMFYDEDCIVYDLEDSVSKTEKDAARQLIFCLLRAQRPENKYVIVRVNGIYSAEIDEDLEAIVRARPDAIRIPKVERVEEIEAVDRKITAIEKAAGLPVGEIKIWCNIESYLGILHAREIAKAGPRVEAMALGAEDYTSSIGASRTKDGWEIFHARNELLLACREAGILAIDSVFADISDGEGLRKDLLMTKNLGFDGKTCIHPFQVEIVNQALAPTQDEINKAIKILETLTQLKNENKGVGLLEGAMIDKAMEKQAKRTLQKAGRIGLLSEEGFCHD